MLQIKIKTELLQLRVVAALFFYLKKEGTSEVGVLECGATNLSIYAS